MSASPSEPVSEAPGPRAPTVNGAPLPPASDRTPAAQAKLQAIQWVWVEFYRRLNAAVRELYQIRATEPFDSDSELRACDTIRSLLREREALAVDVFSLGLLPTPVCKNGYVVDLEFSDPHSLKPKPNPPIESISSTFRIA